MPKKSLWRGPEDDQWKLVPVRPEDWVTIMRYRNVHKGILRQNYNISETTQQEYAKWYAEEMQKERPRLFFYSYIYANRGCSGYGGFSKIDWENKWGETSYLYWGWDRWGYKENFMRFLRMLKTKSAWMGLHRWHSETFAFRKEQMEILEEFGFKREGVIKDYVKKPNGYVDVVIHGKIWEA